MGTILTMPAGLLQAVGGEAGCRNLSKEFYARVGQDTVLQPLFPGKSLRCATNEFAAFLIQFLGGDETQTEDRWWLSIRESHARFRIGPAERSAWLRHMRETLNAAPISDEARKAMLEFFLGSSQYVIGKRELLPEHAELASRWSEQRRLDDLVSVISAGRDQEAMIAAAGFSARPIVFVGLLARMIESGRPQLIAFAMDAVRMDPSLAARRFGGRTLLHLACGAGCVEIVRLLLELGMDADTRDRGGHPPLYRTANECGSEAGRDIVRMLVEAGADPNARGGVTGATALHMAARRGYTNVARALIECGADINATDRRGATPLQRAINCGKQPMIDLLKKFEYSG